MEVDVYLTALRLSIQHTADMLLLVSVDVIVLVVEVSSAMPSGPYMRLSPFNIMDTCCDDLVTCVLV